MIVTIVVSVLGSTALASVIQFLISRHDQKKNLDGKITRLEKDVLRTQLLLLILLMPEEEQEILTVGRHYFIDLEGNWYMTSIFDKWAKKRNINPELLKWFYTR